MKRKRTIRLGASIATAAALLWTGVAAGAAATPPEPDLGVQIIGGQPAVDGQYPWLVALGDAGSGGVFCGGSVITEDVVLTAAHCVEDTDAEDLVVFSGSVDLESDDLVETAVADVHVSEDHNDPIENASDWALLLLDEPVDVEPIAVDQDPAEFDVLETAGWGNTGSGYPTVARWVEVPFVDDEACADAYPGEVDDESMLCAGDLENGGVDSCDGDSGGPLMAPDGDGGQILVGIVSWGYGCAEAGNPGVYAEVADFNDPIESVIEDWGGE